MADLVLSSSSVLAYESCGHRWLLQYIEMHAGVTSMQAAVGTAVHAGAEAYYEGKLQSAIDRDAAFEVADLAYIMEAAAVPDPDEPLAKVRGIVRRVTEAYMDDVGEGITPTMVEQGFRITVDGLHFSGHLDLADNEDVVHDTKVLGQKPRYPDKYRFAFVGYGMGFRALTGREMTKAVLDVMIRLKRDRPRHEPIDYTITEEDEIRFVERLERVAEGISSGTFTPTGVATGECRWCPVRFVCTYGGLSDANEDHD